MRLWEMCHDAEQQQQEDSEQLRLLSVTGARTTTLAPMQGVTTETTMPVPLQDGGCSRTVAGRVRRRWPATIMQLGRDASLPGVEQELQNLMADANDGLCLEPRCASSSEDPGGTVGTSEDREGEVARNERNGAMARGHTTADFVQPTAPSCWETADDPIVTRAETLIHHRDMLSASNRIRCKR